MLALIETMRPRQWTKNLILFAGVIFAAEFFNMSSLAKAVAAFLLFCLLSGSVYIINDLVDLERDRLHPKKSNRPLAAGRLKVSWAVFAAGVIVIGSLLVSFLLNLPFGLTALSYLLLHLAYSLYLKHIVIIDVMTVSLGFVLRAVAGGVVIPVKISPWLLITTALLALFLALGKRRHELVLLESEAPAHRPILVKYSPALLEEMISVVTSSTVVVYSLYTFFSETALKTHYMMFTIPFVLYGIFRYLYLIHQREEGGSPEEILLKDKPLIIDIGLWLVTVIVIFYISR